MDISMKFVFYASLALLYFTHFICGYVSLIQRDAQELLTYLNSHTKINECECWNSLIDSQKLALCRRIKMGKGPNTRMVTHTPRRSQLIIFVHGGGKVFSPDGIQKKVQV